MSVSREIVQGRNLCHVCVVLGDRIAGGLKDHQPEIMEGVLPAGPNGVYMGELKEIVATVGCALCRLVTKALAQSWTTLPLICSGGYLMEVDIYYDGLFKKRYEIGLDIRLRGMTDYDVPEYGNGYVPNGPFLHEIPSPPPRQLFEPAVRLLADDAHLMPTVPAEGALAANVPGEQCNVVTVQNWYKSCRTIHGGLCEISKTDPTDNIQERVSHQPPELQALNMYVVDVQKMCIKFAPAKCRYFALSYVWVLQTLFA